MSPEPPMSDAERAYRADVHKADSLARAANYWAGKCDVHRDTPHAAAKAQALAATSQAVLAVAWAKRELAYQAHRVEEPTP